MVETHLPNALRWLTFVPQSSLNAAEPACVRCAAQSLAGLTLPPPVLGVDGTRYVLPLIVTFLTCTTCFLAVCDQPPSTAKLMPVTVCEPSSATACAHVEYCEPPSC